MNEAERSKQRRDEVFREGLEAARAALEAAGREPAVTAAIRSELEAQK